MEHQGNVFRKPVCYGEVVPDVPVLSNRASAGATRLERICVEEPRGDVQYVNILLHNHIATQCQCLVPVLQSIGGFFEGHIVYVPLPGIMCFTTYKFSQVASSHAANGFLIQGVGPRLKIDQKDATSLGGALAGVANTQASGCVDRDRLCQKDVLVRLDRRGCLFGVEVRWCLDDHGIHRLLEHLSVTGKSCETMLRCDLHSVADGVHTFLEEVGATEKLVVPIGDEQIGDPTASSAATDQAQRDLGICLRSADGRRPYNRNRCCRGSPSQETPSTHLGCIVLHVHLHAPRCISYCVLRSRRFCFSSTCSESHLAGCAVPACGDLITRTSEKSIGSLLPSQAGEKCRKVPPKRPRECMTSWEGRCRRFVARQRPDQSLGG